MNREEGKELAKVLEHWGNGGAIQGMHDCGDWVTIHATRFFPEMGVKYRIKPKPLECWVWVYSDDNWEAVTFKDKDSCEKEFRGFEGRAVMLRGATDEA